MIAIDTNLVVRYLAGDHPEQSARARKVVDENSVFVCLTVILEVEWVLRSAYGFAVGDVTRALRAFAGLPNVTMAEADLVAAALDLADRGMDFADALHLGQARACERFVTFDRKFVKAARAAGHDEVQDA